MRPMKQPVTLTLNEDVRAGLDQVAVAQDRSRSWVADAALRQFLNQHRAEAGYRDNPTAAERTPK